MTPEEYQKNIRYLNERIQEISKRTEQMALTNCANTDNPDFNALMERFNKIVEQSAEITDEMMKAVGLK